MTHCNSCLMPADTKSKPSITDRHPLDNPIEYRSLTEALQYLTLTRPDICFAVQQACLFMHSTNRHLHLVKHILRYIKDTLHHKLHISRSASSDVVIYFDTDRAACPDTRRSISGYCAYFGGNLISWSSKRQPTVSRSSVEAEYHGVTNDMAESCWVCQLLTKLGHPRQRSTLVFCDNISASYLIGKYSLHPHMFVISNLVNKNKTSVSLPFCPAASPISTPLSSSSFLSAAVASRQNRSPHSCASRSQPCLLSIHLMPAYPSCVVSRLEQQYLLPL
jgi:hypothetical protein